MSELTIAGAQLQVATEAAGVWLGTDEFEGLVERVRADVVALFADQVHRSVWAPPVIASAVVARTGYRNSFPHLLGEVSTQLVHTDLMLTAAACHHAYPLIAETMPTAPFCLAVEATCFRNEATAEPGRLRSFRMREIVFVATPDTCLAWRDGSIQLARMWLAELGIDATVHNADDPFFGPSGRLMRATQRDQQLKWELSVPVGDGTLQAVASSNYHKDHFSTAFGFRGRGEHTLHSSCIGFGLERLALVLLARHGSDVRKWPAFSTR
ncbi:MAG TPA: aminoacyl--tRNA ligase-related protein [Micromonosporaceae bacterium]|nr:aminoacyl--tRNA ligase-related protein [Micromonosporaceae bacterium]